jgi:GPH family glycoside/pentoside/hexuronide:cation symporter
MGITIQPVQTPKELKQNAAQPPSALLAMRLLIGPLPALLLMTSMVLAWSYTLSRESYTELRARLAIRRSGAQD